MDTEVLHDFGIIHRSLTRFNRVARNGGLCDSPFFNGRIVCLIFEGSTIGITGHCVIAGNISNLSGYVTNFSISKVQDVAGSFIQNIFRLVVNGAAFRSIGDTISSHFALHSRAITNLVGNLFGSCVGDVLGTQAAVTGHSSSLLSGNSIGLVPVDRVFFFTSNGGFQSAIVIFCSFASHRFRQGSFNGIALVAFHFGAHIAANSRLQILANSIGHIFRRHVGNVLSIIGDGTASGAQADVFGVLADSSNGGAIRYGTADGRVACSIEALNDVNDVAAAYQGIFHLGGRLRRSTVLGSAGFDLLF